MIQTLEQIQAQKEELESQISSRQQTISSLDREEKAYSLIDNVTIIDNTLAEIISESNPKTSYSVNYIKRACTCPNHKYRKAECKHIIATLMFIERQESEPIIESAKSTPVISNTVESSNSFDEYAAIFDGTSIKDPKELTPTQKAWRTRKENAKNAQKLESKKPTIVVENTQGLINKDLLLD